MAKVHNLNLGLLMSTTTVIPTELMTATMDSKVLFKAPVNVGWMEKKGRINTNWKRRYFEMFHDGKLIYYTDETKQTRKGVADLTTIIGFHTVNNKRFEVITPQRTWCFECKFKSECDYWIETMKSIKHSHVHHDRECPNDRDHLHLSSNRNVLKLMAKMGPAEGERILYSDFIVVTNKHRQESIVLMLTTMALYHFNSIQNSELKKCQRRTAWRSVACCIVLSPQEISIADVVYRTETKNLRVILQTLCEADNEVIFRRDEDEIMFRGDLEPEDEDVFADFLPNKSSHSSMSFVDTKGASYKYTAPSYVDPDGIDTASFEMEPGFGSSESAESDDSSDGSVSTLNSLLLRSPSRSEGAKSSRKSSKNSLRARDFTFLSVIGRGSFGKILLVQKKGNDDTVFAMKILKKKQIIQLNLERHIKAERDVLKSIDHPFIMKMRYAFQSESKLYFVLDYYRGGDLNHHLRLKGRFNAKEAKFIAAQIALAIGCLHSHGIVYRDLKPENILMDDVGNCCLTDFGLCKDLSDYDVMKNQKPKNGRKRRLQSTQTPCGTAEYLAPEVIREVAYDQNVDWWSFGILIFELTVGVVPFFSMSKFDMFQKITSAPLLFASWMEDDCQKLVGALLQRTVDQRLGFYNDIDDITAHPWFHDVDWNLLLQKKVDPPYCPDVDVSDGMVTAAQNVATQYLEEAPVDTFAPKPEVDGVFEGFTFNENGGEYVHALKEGSSVSVTTSKSGSTTLNLPISEMFNNLSLYDEEIMGKLQEGDEEEEDDLDDDLDDDEEEEEEEQ